MGNLAPVGTAAAGDRVADIAVIGAGILGLATARALSRGNPRLEIVVLDKEDGIAQHQTGRNSGVIHSGIYYVPGSLKAELCVRGGAALWEYCAEKGIATSRCGKVVVAATTEEIPRLEELHRRGVANGAAALELIGPERLRELEPHVAGVRGLHVPGTGIVDYGCVARAYADDVTAAGGEVLLGREVTAIRRSQGRILLETSAGSVEAQHVVACAGVHADRIARLGGGALEPRIVPFRGDYYVLRPERRFLANALVYPVPDPSFPFLGIHTTLRIDGSMWLGPNAVLAYAREGYRRYDIQLGDLTETLRAPGFRRIARRYWRTGLGEMVRATSKRLFVASARRLIPELEPADVVRGPSGIRAQALSLDGTLVDDFVIEHRDGVVHVRNAPSPGATSSLAIGERIAEIASDAFGLS